MTRLAVLGAGNIAYAIASGLVREGFAAADIIAADPAPAQRARFTAMGIRETDNNVAAASEADVLLVSVKPDVVEAICGEVREAASGKTAISVAAGITAGSLATWLGHENVVRCMPNTPALVGEGMIGLYALPAVSEEAKTLTTSLFTPVGKATWFDDESMLDPVTAVSGSGPAYFFLVMEAMQAAAVEMGFSKEEARQLVQQTALGAATMALASEDEVATLRENVTSPGGTTAAALNVLEEGGLRDLFANALDAARVRSIELSGN